MAPTQAGTQDPQQEGDARLPWYAAPVYSVLDRLVSSEGGLSEDEAVHRTELVGPHRITAADVDSAWRILARQLRSSVALLLTAAIAGTLVLDRPIEGLVIGLVLAMNVVIGFAAEWRSRSVLDSVLSSLRPDAIVLRDGRRVRVDSSRLVPGDVIEVTEGQRVPADARVIISTGLRVEQGALSGDATPVDKTAEPCALGAPLPLRASMLFTGSTVTQGGARAVVTATGGTTAIVRLGRLRKALERRVPPPRVRTERLGRRMAWLALCVAAVALPAGAMRGQGLESILETWVAVALAATPLALLAVSTITLSLALRRVSRGGIRVAHPGAIEALGTGTVVCADAIGTLTAGPSRVTRIVTPSSRAAVMEVGAGTPGWLDVSPATPAANAEVELLLRAAALSVHRVPDQEGASGDPTPRALWRLLEAQGRDPTALFRTAPVFAVIPYDEAHRMSASFRREEKGPAAFVRGAPDAVLARCGRISGPLGSRDLDAAGRTRIEADARALAMEGYRVVAFASHPTATRTEDLAEPLVYLGMLGLEEEPDSQVAATIADLGDAGIRTVLFTEEEGATGRSIAAKAGVRIRDDHVIDHGRLGPSRPAPAPGGTSTMLFGGLGADGRRRIVERLIGGGEVVIAVLGEGWTSLGNADATVSTQGPDSGRAAADVDLGEGHFASLVEAVRRSRLALAGVRRSGTYLLGCSVAELIVVASAAFFDWPLPLLPLQLIWLKLLISVPASLALAAESEDTGVMARSPGGVRRGILTRDDVFTAAGFGLAMSLPTLAAFALALTMRPVDQAVTLAFATLALAQLFYVGNARGGALGIRLGHPETNPWLLRAVLAGLALLVAAVYWVPLAGTLGTVPLGPVDWALAFGLSAATALLGRFARGQDLEQRLEGWGQRLKGGEPAPVGGEEATGRSVLLFEETSGSRLPVGRVSAGTEDPWPGARGAVQSGDVERLRALVRWYPKLVHARDDEGTLLHHATGMPTLSWSPGGPELVTVLVEAGADPDAGERLDGSGETPLIQAVSLNNTPVARRLLELGAHPERHGRYPEQGIDTALGYALLYGKDPWFGLERGDCVELLLDWGAVASLPHKAALGRNAAVLEMLPDATPEDRRRALVFAAHRGEARVVRSCLEAGVDATKLVSFFHERLTPLLAAAGQGHLDTVQVLLDAGVEPEWPEDRLGTNAMVWAWTRSGDGGPFGAEPGRKRSGLGS